MQVASSRPARRRAAAGVRGGGGACRRGWCTERACQGADSHRPRQYTLNFDRVAVACGRRGGSAGRAVAAGAGPGRRHVPGRRRHARPPAVADAALGAVVGVRRRRRGGVRRRRRSAGSAGPTPSRLIICQAEANRPAKLQSACYSSRPYGRAADSKGAPLSLCLSLVRARTRSLARSLERASEPQIRVRVRAGLAGRRECTGHGVVGSWQVWREGVGAIGIPAIRKTAVAAGGVGCRGARDSFAAAKTRKAGWYQYGRQNFRPEAIGQRGLDKDSLNL